MALGWVGDPAGGPWVRRSKVLSQRLGVSWVPKGAMGFIVFFLLININVLGRRVAWFRGILSLEDRVFGD